MKNKLFYLVGAAFLLCSIGTFTSCINGVDDEYLELINSGNGGGDKPNDEEEELPDLNGDYYQGGDFELKMTYNSEELTGKLVNVAADETNETATITLAGLEQDMSEMVGGLLEFKFETFSPVPGVKEIVLPDVKLFSNGTGYQFAGELIDPTYTLIYKGIIEDGKMEINIDHQLVNRKLAGVWDLGPKSITHGNSAWLYSPLWIDWDSRIQVNLGRVSIANIKGEMNGIFSILTGAISPLIIRPILGVNLNTMDVIRNMLKGVTVLPNGSIFATYSYSGDMANPAWSSQMPRNALRYYYDPENPDSRLRLELNPSILVSLISGLINPEEPTRADPGLTQELGRQLIALLTPLLQEGIPCDYVVEGGNLTINIDGIVLRDILLKVFELANDEIALPVVEEFIKANLGDFSPNIMALLRQLPYTLKYYEAEGYDENNVPINPTGECTHVKLGLKLVRNR